MARPRKKQAAPPVLTLDKLRQYCDDNRRVYVDVVLMDGRWYIYAVAIGTAFGKMTQVQTSRDSGPDMMNADRLWNMLMKVKTKLPEITPRIVAGTEVYQSERPSRVAELIGDALLRHPPFQRAIVCDALGLFDLGAGMEANIINTIQYRREELGEEAIIKALAAIGLELKVLES